MNDLGTAKPKIAVIDYQAGNIRSVEKALTQSGADAVVSSVPGVIESCDGVVFPGQGACDSSMLNLRSHSLDHLILRLISNEKPFLGVCLGLQLLLQHSEEGDEDCLGLIEGTVKRFPQGHKIPHMGWNEVNIRSDHPVLSGVPNNSYFYFAGSSALCEISSKKPLFIPDPDLVSKIQGIENVDKTRNSSGRSI